MGRSASEIAIYSIKAFAGSTHPTRDGGARFSLNTTQVHIADVINLVIICGLSLLDYICDAHNAY